jgi:hypothetical protein
MSVDELVEALTDPQVRASTTSFNTMLFTNYMKDEGPIKKMSAGRKDYFFPVAQKLRGG